MSGFPLIIESCNDCPRLSKRHTRHWSGASGWEFTCTQANRYILPREGVKPPPDWCPKRPKGEGESGE